LYAWLTRYVNWNEFTNSLLDIQFPFMLITARCSVMITIAFKAGAFKAGARTMHWHMGAVGAI
jgi:hypothetical protein